MFGWRDARSDQNSVMYGVPPSDSTESLGGERGGPYGYPQQRSVVSQQQQQQQQQQRLPVETGGPVYVKSPTYVPQQRGIGHPHAPAPPHYTVYSPPGMSPYGQYAGMHDPNSPVYESSMQPQQAFYDPYARAAGGAGGGGPYLMGVGSSSMDTMQSQFGGLTLHHTSSSDNLLAQGQWQSGQGGASSGMPSPTALMAGTYGGMNSTTTSSDSIEMNSPGPGLTPQGGKGQGDASRDRSQQQQQQQQQPQQQQQMSQQGSMRPVYRNYQTQQPMLGGPEIPTMGMVMSPVVYPPNTGYYTMPQPPQMHLSPSYLPANQMYPPQMQHQGQGGRMGSRGPNRYHDSSPREDRRSNNRGY